MSELAKELMRNVSEYRIVRVDGDWGVVVGKRNPNRLAPRIVDFWVGGRQYVRPTKLVEVLPR